MLGAEPATNEDLERVHTAAFIDATDAGRARRGRRLVGVRVRAGGQPDLPGHARGGRDRRRRDRSLRRRPCGEGRVEHAFNAAGGLHHAMPARASGFCVYDDPAVAIAWLLANGAERVAYVDRRRPPRRRGPGDLLERAARAHDLAPRVRALPVLPRDGGPHRARWSRRPGERDQRAVARQHRRRRVARRAVHDRAARGRGLRSRRARDPAGVRHARDRSARAAPADDAQLSRGRARAARHRARLGGRPLGRDRRRRLPLGPRRAARLDAVLRRDGARRRRSAGRAPRVVDRGRDGSRRRAGADDVLGAAARRPSRRRGRARAWSRGSPTYCGPDGAHEARLHARPRERLAEPRAGSGPGRDVGVPAELLARHSRGARADGAARARGRGRDGQAARRARRSARAEGAVVDGGPGSVHVPAGAAVRAPTRGRGGRARRLHHVPGPVGRPPGGRPRPARRRSGRADRDARSPATWSRPSASQAEPFGAAKA